MIGFKKIKIPNRKYKKSLEAVELYEVRWKSRNGDYSGDTKEEVEVFTSRKDAKEFEESLKEAFKILKYSGWGVTDVDMRKRD